MQVLLAFLSKKIHYPEAVVARGSINLRLWIDADGRFKDLKIIQKAPLNDSLLEREFFRVFKLMPRWTPGKCAGKRVFVEMPFLMRVNLQD
ncbi:hypothetical protein [Mucilaginibacter sp. CSA2-8R]|uniref:hypothetical protein n=1 Tax=Mucilaginibacter sp. CSA2-8R TaxID=3141542 RepID=UPI00315D8924